MTLDLGAAVEAAVDSALKARVDEVSQHQLVAAILAKPFIVLPEDLMIVLGIGRSTAFELVQGSDFPKTVKVGRQRLLRTALLLEWLQAREGAA